MQTFTPTVQRRLITLLCSFLVLFSQASAQQYIGRQKVDQFPVTSWGQQTYGLTWLPSDYNSSNDKYPLIIFLHGSGEGGTSVGSLYNLISTALPQRIAQGWNPEAVNPADGKNYKFIVVSPQAPGWSYSYTHVQHILEDVQDRYRVDPKRIYITGLSAGGAGAWSTVTNGENFAKKIAAIVPVSGAGTNTTQESDQIPLVGGTYGVKTWSICGMDDSFWSLAQVYTNTVNNAPNPPSVSDVASGIPGAGHSSAAWNTAYDPNWRSNNYNLNVYEWMLKWTRNNNGNNGNGNGNGNNSNVAPTANAGGDKAITLPASGTQLNGSGNDADGNVVGYQWTKVAGPSSFLFSNGSTSEATTQDVYVSQLIAGTYTFRLKVTDNKGASTTDEMNVVVNPAINVVVPVPPPSSGNYVMIPARIEAENWSNMSNVLTEPTQDEGGGLNVGYIDNDDWMEYRVTAPVTGTYMVRFRIATPHSNAELQLTKSDGTLLSRKAVPNTGSFQSWNHLDVFVTLQQGQQTLRVQSTKNANWNFNWIEFFAPSGAIAPPPPAGGGNTSVAASGSTTRIEAENWSNMQGVQTENTSDAGGGLNVGYIDKHDWMDYSYNAPVSGTYTISFRVASGGRFSIEVGGNTLEKIKWENTGGFQIWQTISTTINLSAGAQTIRLISDGGTPNINWIELRAPGATTTARMAGGTEELATAAGGEKPLVEAGAKAAIRVFPNPIEERFTLQLNSDYTGTVKVVIRDTKGSAVKNFTLTKGAKGAFQAYLSLQGLATGTYTLSTYQNGEQAQSLQIIKR